MLGFNPRAVHSPAVDSWIKDGHESAPGWPVVLLAISCGTNCAVCGQNSSHTHSLDGRNYRTHRLWGTNPPGFRYLVGPL